MVHITVIGVSIVVVMLDLVNYTREPNVAVMGKVPLLLKEEGKDRNSLERIAADV